jgi:uncharacterized protein
MRPSVPISENPDWQGLESNRSCPSQKPVMTQIWDHLLFLHATVEPSLLASLIPDGLELQTYEGAAYLGFVPFAMRNVRPAGFPAFSPLSNFLETNVRTYVTHPTFGPGVWFFSLDADSYLPCLIARLGFKLPYYQSAMFLDAQDDTKKYYGTRLHRQRLPAVFEPAPPLKSYNVELRHSNAFNPTEPGSLEYWLCERYRLYGADKSGKLITGRVWHEPYQVNTPTMSKVEISGLDSILGNAKFDHALYAKGVAIQAFKIEKI